MNVICKHCWAILDEKFKKKHKAHHDSQNLIEFFHRIELLKELQGKQPAAIILSGIWEAYDDFNNYRFKGFKNIPKKEVLEKQILDDLKSFDSRVTGIKIGKKTIGE